MTYRTTGQDIFPIPKKFGDVIHTDPANRSAFDFYPTPEPLIRAALLRAKADCFRQDFHPQIILDPGAGSGAWGTVARSIWPDARIVGVEARDVEKPFGYDDWFRQDFLTWESPYPAVDLVIGNPPYGVGADNTKHKHLAEHFVRKAISVTALGGYVYFLLLLSFSESAYRARGFWKEYQCAFKLTLADRPSFKPRFDKKRQRVIPNGTDARAYAMYLWRAGLNPKWYQGGVLEWKASRNRKKVNPDQMELF